MPAWQQVAPLCTCTPPTRGPSLLTAPATRPSGTQTRRGLALPAAADPTVRTSEPAARLQGVCLRVIELASGAQLLWLPLPSGRAYRDTHLMLWAPDCNTIAVRFGEHLGLPAVAAQLPAGLVFVQLATSSCSIVQLQPQRQLMLGLGPPSQASPWSSTGHLLVGYSHRGEEPGAIEHEVLAVYSAHGCAVATVAMQELAGYREHAPTSVSLPCWSPSGQIACLVVCVVLPHTALQASVEALCESTTLCLWKPFSGGAHLRIKLMREQVRRLSWSPCSRYVLVNYYRIGCNLWSSTGRVFQQGELGVDRVWPCLSWGVLALTSVGQALGAPSVRTRGSAGALYLGDQLLWHVIQGKRVQSPFLPVGVGPRVFAPSSGHEW